MVGRVWSFRDVTPARVAQDQITRAMADLAEQAAQLKALAFQDPLTGLSNRQLFNDHLEAALRGPCGTAVDVLLLDLDDFKEVNDILGHHAGDQLLIEVGRRLRECVRPNDVVARLGGDEFVVLLVGSLAPDAVAERIVASVRVPLRIDGTMLRPSLSLGLASINEDAVDASELLRRADVAMYAAKAAGKNRYLRFRPEMMKSLVERTELEAGLRLAVDAGEIAVHYQPILSTRSGVVVKVEALARWERGRRHRPPGAVHPRGGAQRPDRRDRHGGAAEGLRRAEALARGGPRRAPSPSTSPGCSCSTATSPSCCFAVAGITRRGSAAAGRWRSPKACSSSTTAT